MAGLLSGDLFRGWELRNAELGLLSRIEIQGSINSDYWTDEEKKKLIRRELMEKETYYNILADRQRLGR